MLLTQSYEYVVAWREMNTATIQTTKQTIMNHDTICMKCDVWKENDNSPIVGCRKCPRAVHPQCVPSSIDIKDGFVCSDIGKDFKCEKRRPVISKIMPPVKYNEKEKRYECKKLKLQKKNFFCLFFLS